MKEHRILKLAVAAGALTATGAMAQGYVGGGVGTSRVDVDCPSEATKCDRTSNGWKLFGGYRFHPNIAAEANYFDFGKARIVVADGGEGGSVDADVSAKGWGLGVAGFFNFTPQWVGVARAGLGRMTGRVSLSGDASGSCSKTSTQPYFGVGVGYAFTPNLTVDLAADFSRVKFCSETNLDDASVRLLSLGLTYRF